MNVNKIVLLLLCAICLFMVSCGNDDEPEIRPISFLDTKICATVMQLSIFSYILFPHVKLSAVSFKTP